MIRVRRRGRRHHCVTLSAVATSKTEFCSTSYSSIVSFVGIEKGIWEVYRAKSPISNVGRLAEFVGMPTGRHFPLSSDGHMRYTL